MGRFRLLVIALTSLLLVICSSFFKRVIAVSLCGVLGINSPACYFLGQGRVVASVPPGGEKETIFAQDIDIFRNDDSNSSGNSDIDIFRNDGGDNTPSNSDINIFSNPNPSQQDTTINNSQVSTANAIVFGLPSIEKLSSDSFALTVPSNKGCKFKSTVKSNEDSIYQESISFFPSNTEECGSKPFIAQIVRGGKVIEIQQEDQPGLFVIEQISNESIKITHQLINNSTNLVLTRVTSDQVKAVYQNAQGKTELGTFPIPNERISELEQNKSLFYKNTKPQGKSLKINQEKIDKLCNFGKGVCNQLSALSKSVLIYTAGWAAAGNLVPAIGAALSNPATAAALTTLTGAMAAGGAAATLANFGCWFMFGGGLPDIPLLPKGPQQLNEVAYTLSSDLASETGVDKPINEGLAKIREKLNLDLCDKDDEPEIAETPRSGDLTTGTSYGDPHLITFDGFRYSFQTVGEYILAKSLSGDFELQTRQAPVPGRQLSLNAGAAMKVGSDRIAFYAKFFPDSDTSTPLRVNGVPTTIQGESLSLPGGGTIYKQGSRSYLVQWATGEQVAIKEINVAGSQYMNVTPAALNSPGGQFTGLLGNLDGDPGNDLRTRSGSVIPSKSTYGDIKNLVNRIVPIPGAIGQIENVVFDQLYKDFGNSWRVSQEESLFDYAPGQTTATFTDTSFPSQYRTLNALSPQQVEQAEATCLEAGVEPDLLEGCIFDVGFTGEASFAQAAANAFSVIEQFDRLIPGGLPIPKPPIRIPGLPF